MLARAVSAVCSGAPRVAGRRFPVGLAAIAGSVAPLALRRSISLTAKSYLIPTLRLSSHDVASPESFLSSVRAKVDEAPLFYRSAPISLDVSAVTQATPDELKMVVNGLRDISLLPICVTNAQQGLVEGAHAAGLAVVGGASIKQSDVSNFEPTTNQEISLEEAGHRVADAMEQGLRRVLPSTRVVASTAGEEEAIEVVDEEERSMTIVHGPVRSGQQVYAKDTALVVMGNVSSGAEIMADGDIFVMGTLRGRVVAGMSGDAGARIFATRLQPELVCIGDTFCAGDAVPHDVTDADVACSVWSDGEELHFSLANAY